MRYLAIDLGQKRTGLAVGSDVTRLATPVGMIESRDDKHRLEQLADAIAEHAPDAIVLGLPLSADGSEGPAAKQMRRLAEQMQQRFNLPVHLVDERLTSFSADQRMNQTGLTHGQKKARRDALAAARILQDFLDQAQP